MVFSPVIAQIKKAAISVTAFFYRNKKAVRLLKRGSHGFKSLHSMHAL
jgi:hypothetical protein